MTEQQQTLQSQLWNIANTLRGNMDANSFKDYMLGFIFYKYLSEKVEYYMDDQLREDEITFSEAFENEALREELQALSVEGIGYFLEPQFLFSTVAEKARNGAFILDNLAAAFKEIEQSTLGSNSEEDFMHLFDDVDLTSIKLGKNPEERNRIICDVVLKISALDFHIGDVEFDVLGDAYEYLIGQFASGAGQKAGEFYTPQQVSKILAKIVTMGKSKLKTVYDPTCGSGSLLLRVAKEADVDSFYGQESNPTTFNLARMNMLLHGVRYEKFDIQQGDTLENPLHLDMRFDAVVANPPFSAQWTAADRFKSDDRYSKLGVLAPKTKADYAFIQHMIHQLSDAGTMACVAPHGVLFRGAAEGKIRQYLIESKNFLDGVIGLPANVFYGTSIPTCILVFKKCRENPEDIFFIDASNHFEKVKTQNVLRDEDVERIIATYTARENVEKYAYKATLDEVKSNDYNLNIPRYVDTFEEEEHINLDQVVAAIQAEEAAMKPIDAQITEFCKELDIKAPYSSITL